MGRRPRQREKALTFVRLEAARVRQEGTGALAGLKQLAKSAGVGYNTMWEAVQECKDRGELRVKPHAGITVIADAPGPPETDAAPVSRVRRALHERVGSLLESDILAGTFPGGATLPPVKVLCGRYGVCPVTLRKILERLTSHGLVLREPGGYRAGSGSALSGSGHIVLVARGDEHGNVRSVTPRGAMHLRLIEQECGRRGVGLTTCTHYFAGDRWKGTQSLERIVSHDRTADTVLGYLILTASVADEPLVQDLQHLVRCGKPVVVFDETVATPALHQKFRGPLLRYYVLPDDLAAGRIVGDHLIRRGHRRVMFLSNVGTYRGSPSLRRLGLAHAFSDAGMETAVRECELPRSDVDWACNPHDYEPVVSGFLDSHHPAGLRGSAHRHPELAGELAEEMGRRLMRYARRTRIWSSLENALDKGDSTAWVCYNDELAVDCLDLLARRSTDVPLELSVVGFDDSDEASMRGLTSYNFNGAAYVHAMLEYLQSPSRHATYRRDSDIMRFDGFVTPRRTCGPSRSATAVPTR